MAAATTALIPSCSPRLPSPGTQGHTQDLGLDIQFGPNRRPETPPEVARRGAVAETSPSLLGPLRRPGGPIPLRAPFRRPCPSTPKEERFPPAPPSLTPRGPLRAPTRVRAAGERGSGGPPTPRCRSPGPPRTGRRRGGQLRVSPRRRPGGRNAAEGGEG